MIIIVEGIDRVGKTTLCNALNKQLNIPILKDSYMTFQFDDTIIKPTRDNCITNIERMNSILNFVECANVKNNIIIDRFHMSEYVYDLIDRRHESLHAFKQLDIRLYELNTIIVYIRPTDLKESSKQHGKDLTPHFKIFEELITLTKCKMICGTYNDINDIVNKIKEMM